MKFLSFIKQNQPYLGLLVDGDGVFNLSAYLTQHDGHGLQFIPTNVSQLIALGEIALTNIQKTLLDIDMSEQELTHLDNVEVLPPLDITKNVFCVGRNYREHIIEGNIANGRPANSFPEAIEFFSKPSTAVIGHKGHVNRHANLTNSLDYEVELAIVIGRRGTNISRENALDHVFGYTIVNDITARDLQKRHGQWLKGKSLDTTCPMGPVVTHRSAIENPNDLNVSLTVNGELRQSENTSSMIFSIETIIEQLSAGLTLEPGDVIATGTPKGVGFAMTPPRCLEVGDVVSAQVQGIGTLTNEITA
ncbi:fumarylacetoacetate hydrolase family protein [Alcaligenaceae bacterium]|nr:fumarylacetoacetate hydrolase family protein [Alcaligenaceae bacterium]